MSDKTYSYGEWTDGTDSASGAFVELGEAVGRASELIELLMDSMCGYIPTSGSYNKHIIKLQGKIGWGRKSKMIRPNSHINVRAQRNRTHYALRGR